MRPKQADIKENPVVAQSLTLLQRLLTPERTRIELVSGRPIVSAASVGALAVVGMKTEAPKTWVSVYIFRTWNEATRGLRTVEVAAGARPGVAGGQMTISALNGHMVLYGRGAVDGKTADFTRYVLNNILSAFDEEC
jgi:hypothetical protein